MKDMTVDPKTEAAWKKDGLGANQLGATYFEAAQKFLSQAVQKWTTDGSADGVDKATWDAKFLDTEDITFDEADESSDGKVSQAEFILLQSTGALIAEFLARNTAKASTDGNAAPSEETLSEPEWNEAGLPEKIGVNYARANTDGTEGVNLNEFLNEARNAFELPSLKGIKAHIKIHKAHMDEMDGSAEDGKVSLAEYMAWREEEAANDGGNEFINATSNAVLQALVGDHLQANNSAIDAAKFFKRMKNQGFLMASKSQATAGAGSTPGDAASGVANPKEPTNKPDSN